MKKAMLVVNPCAGRKIANLDVAYIVLTMQKNGYNVKVFYTNKSGDATNYARKYGNNFDIIVCCGGDGTFHEVINGVVQIDKDISIGYIPTGTTNDFARSIGISLEIRDVVQAIIENEPKSYDIGTFNDEYFTYVAAFGAFAEVSYSTPQKSKNMLGHFAYVLEALKNLKKIVPVKAKFNIGNECIEDEFIFGAIANSSSIGGILRFKKNKVYFDDGKFEFILIKKPANAYELCKTIVDLKSENYENDNIIFGTANKIKAEFADKANWNLDGEYVETGSTVAIENLQSRIKIIT